jgi:hypothetical protein
MATTTVSSVRDLDAPVVDCDFHLTETAEDVMAYVEPPFDRMLAGASSYSGSVNPYPSSGLLHPSVTTGRTKVFNEETLDSPAAIAEARELLGLDHPIMDPGSQLSLGMVHHEQVASALATAYNEYLLDTFLDEDPDLHATMVVAPQDPERAAEEVADRADEDGFVGVFVPSGGVNPPFGHRTYDPLYAACERAGLPVVMHGVAGGAMNCFPVQYDAYDRHMPVHVISHPFHHMANITDMVTRGVPERFPDLEFVMQEAGVGYIPFLMKRLDYEYYGQRQDAPLLEKPPSEYLSDQFYYTSQPVEGTEDPNYVQSMVELLGPESFMFASDYPHHDFDNTEDIFSVLRGAFDADELGAMFGGTAMEVYDF